MTYFTDRLVQIIRKAGMATDPRAYAGRRATTSDLNSTNLEKIYQGLEAEFGKGPARSFVNMVADVSDLSASNFLLALSSLETAKGVWDPENIGYQQRYSQPSDTLLAADHVDKLGAENLAGGSMFGFLMADGMSMGDSHPRIAGKFLEKYGTREQVTASQGYELAARRGQAPGTLTR